MVLECIGVNDSSCGPEMHGKVCICWFPGLFKLLRVGHHVKNLVHVEFGLQGYYCDIFC